MDYGDGNEIILSLIDETIHDLAEDSGLYLNLSAADADYWIACVPGNYQQQEMGSLTSLVGILVVAKQ